ncbi:MAG TPA: hypothetical protein PKD02_06525 [Thermomonas sp.]|nr:hypothetical protein [Thermomonas sp.]
MLRLLLVPVFGYLLLVDSGQSERSRWLAAIVFVVAAYILYRSGSALLA